MQMIAPIGSLASVDCQDGVGLGDRARVSHGRRVDQQFLQLELIAQVPGISGVAAAAAVAPRAKQLATKPARGSNMTRSRIGDTPGLVVGRRSAWRAMIARHDRAVEFERLALRRLPS